MSSWGTKASYSETSCDFLLGFFFQSDRPTQDQETHLTLNEKKGGWPKTQTNHQTFALLGITFISQLNVDFAFFNLSQADAVETRRGKFVSHFLRDSSL